MAQPQDLINHERKATVSLIPTAQFMCWRWHCNSRCALPHAGYLVSLLRLLFSRCLKAETAERHSVQAENSPSRLTGKTRDLTATITASLSIMSLVKLFPKRRKLFCLPGCASPARSISVTWRHCILLYFPAVRSIAVELANIFPLLTRTLIAYMSLNLLSASHLE